MLSDDTGQDIRAPIGADFAASPITFPGTFTGGRVHRGENGRRADRPARSAEPDVRGRRGDWMSLRAAHRAHSFAELARIARRLAVIAGERLAAASGGPARLITDAASLRRSLGAPLGPGFALVQPPLIGVDARSLRDRAERRRTPLIVITREPLTRAGLWPIVAATSSRTIRTRIEPPAPLERVESSMTRDRADLVPDEAWFVGAVRALGRAAIDGLDAALHPWWRVDDLVELCDVHCDDGELFEALAECCAEAAASPAPDRQRPRDFGHPHCF